MNNRIEIESNLKEKMILTMKGDREAYRCFLLEVGKIIERYLIRKIGNSESLEKVEDLTQDILFSIHLKKSSYRIDLPILPWIYAIAKHRMIDQLRVEKRMRFFGEDDFISNLIDAEAETGKDFESKLEVENLLSGINERQKKILILSKVLRMPIKEIADKMGMSLSAAKVSIHRTLKVIRKKAERNLKRREEI